MSWPATKLVKQQMFDELYPPFDPWWAFSSILAELMNTNPKRKDWVKPSEFYPKVLDEDEQAEEIIAYLNKKR